MKTGRRGLVFFVFVVLLFGPVACGSTQSEGARSSAGAKGEHKHLDDYKRKHFNLFSEKDDIKLGEYVMKLQIKEFKKEGVGVDLPKHQELKARVEKIVHRLAAVSDKPDFPYEVHIFDRPDVVNAFAMPGGKIGVFTGLFDREKGLVDINNDDQIAAVIGHEMAHATVRHITRRLTTYQGINLIGLAGVIGFGQGLGPNAEYIFNQVFSLGVNLYLPSYSRKHEKEADQIGFYYLAKAGYNPQAAIDIWKKAAAKGGPNSKRTDFFASHPASGERAKALEAWLPEALQIQSSAGAAY
ncbi:MAG: M48 family metallopeptidase [Deltaproteobacteria bacterium]|nr:M48 family metallopeptidase [Deltaproteobacteria bacterium]